MGRQFRQTISEWGVVTFHVPFYILGALFISQEWLKHELLHFVQSFAKRMSNHPQKGRGWAHVTNFCATVYRLRTISPRHSVK